MVQFLTMSESKNTPITLSNLIKELDDIGYGYLEPDARYRRISRKIAHRARVAPMDEAIQAIGMYAGSQLDLNMAILDVLLSYREGDMQTVAEEGIHIAAQPRGSRFPRITTGSVEREIRERVERATELQGYRRKRAARRN